MLAHISDRTSPHSEFADMVQFSGPVFMTEDDFTSHNRPSLKAGAWQNFISLVARVGLLSSCLAVVAASSLLAFYVR